MLITARSTPNIALIKYWGNRNEELRLPAADSLSMTLNTPQVDIDVETAEVLHVRSFEFDGVERAMTMKHLLRFQKHLEMTKHYLTHLGVADTFPSSVSLTIRSGIPPSVGIASSAAVFSCLAEAYAGLVADKRILTRQEVSVIARLGSGSACRGVLGGYVAMTAGEGDVIESSTALQVADESHWKLYDIMVVPTKREMITESHAFARTSPLFAKRLQEVPRRQAECIDAIRTRNFEKLQHVCEEDGAELQEVMRTSTPPVQRLTRETLRIVEEMIVYRRMKHIPVLYTLDPGPSVHLLCPQEAKEEVLHFAHEQEGCFVFVAHTGKGSHVLTNTEKRV